MDRNFKTFFTAEQLTLYQRGVMEYSYRGRSCHKSPIDIALYIRLLDQEKPKSLIEIGSFRGGSAHLFRDIGRMLEINLEVISIDRNRVSDQIDGVRFLDGDVNDLAAAFREHQLFALPRPWLVIEDSAHTSAACLATLLWFAEHLMPGEWLVMEDGVLTDLGRSRKYNGGPNQAIADFMQEHPGIFEIRIEYCDAYGKNATYNPNGYLSRTTLPFRPK